MIADFMGVFDKILSTNNVHSWSDTPYFYTTENSIEKVKENIAKYAKYSTSWNWLMPVVHKILSDGFDLWLVPPKLMDNIILAIQQPNIQQVFELVVEFIKWHNEQHPVIGSFDENGDTVL